MCLRSIVIIRLIATLIASRNFRFVSVSTTYQWIKGGIYRIYRDVLTCIVGASNPLKPLPVLGCSHFHVLVDKELKCRSGGRVMTPPDNDNS